MNVQVSDLPALLDDLDRAIGELGELSRRDPHAWTWGVPGKWTAGQHVAHVGKMMALSADAFEASAGQLARGELPPAPRRGLLQALAVRVLMGNRFPRGGKSVPGGVPDANPDRARTLEHLAEGARRHRAIAERHSPADLERLWIRNPFITTARRHYRLNEMVRVQATHARHHGRQAAEAAAAHA